MRGRWLRRRPENGERREELEAHVAIRAEHDGVDLLDTGLLISALARKEPRFGTRPARRLHERIGSGLSGRPPATHLRAVT